MHTLDATRDRALVANLSSPRVRFELDPGKVEHGLMKLVLTLFELIRQLMEKQATRRIEAGNLTIDEMDRLGRGLMEAEDTVKALQAQFGIDDLNLDLGPLGRLLSDNP